MIFADKSFSYIYEYFLFVIFAAFQRYDTSLMSRFRLDLQVEANAVYKLAYR